MYKNFEDIDPEKFLSSTHDWNYIVNNEDTYKELLDAIIKYGKACWNNVLELVNETATTDFSGDMVDYCRVNQESILKHKLNA